MFYRCYRKLIRYERIIEKCEDGVAYSVGETIEGVKEQKLAKYQDVLVFGEPHPSNGYCSPSDITIALTPHNSQSQLIREITTSQNIYFCEELLMNTSKKDHFSSL